VKPNPDPLRRDPVATVVETCVGCGLCGEVAHAAVLCPSFYRADIVSNPNWWDRTLDRVRSRVIGWLAGEGAPDLETTPLPSSPPSSRHSGARERGSGVGRNALRQPLWTQKKAHGQPQS
jgi:hypothetical protein